MPKKKRKTTRKSRATPKDFAVAFLITALLAVIVLATIAAVRGWRQGEVIPSEPQPEGAEPAPATVFETSPNEEPRPMAGAGADGALSLAVPSRDGRHLAWTGTREGRSGLWLAGPSGEDPELLAPGNPSPGVHPAWSDEDSRIAWLERVRPGVGELRVTPMASSDASKVGEVECAEAAGVAWTPGDDRVLVADPATDKLLAVPMGGGEPAIAAEGIRCGKGSPGIRAGRSQLDVYVLDDRSRHVLGSTERTALTEWIEPAPDGEVVAIVEAPALNGRVVKVAVAPAGYETRPRYQRGRPGWAHNAPMPGFLAWSLDSTRLLLYFPRDRRTDEPIGVFRGDGEADAVVLDRGQGTVISLLRWPGEGDEARAGWIDESRICYLEGAPPGPLWLVDSTTGESELLWDAEAGEEGEGE
jgi:hypothetical protein